MPLTLLEHGFLRWPRHVTRLDSRRHQQVTRYVLKDGMDRAACHETICFRLLKCHGRFSIIALDGKIKGVFLSDYKVTHTHDTIMFCFRRNELFFFRRDGKNFAVIFIRRRETKGKFRQKCTRRSFQ
jgi:hypothetical protein